MYLEPYLSPAIRLQTTLADLWIPEQLAKQNAELSEDEFYSAVECLLSCGQVRVMFNDNIGSIVVRQGFPERFIERKHPQLTARQVSDATEYALRRGLLDEAIRAELDAAIKPKNL